MLQVRRGSEKYKLCMYRTSFFELKPLVKKNSPPRKNFRRAAGSLNLSIQSLGKQPTSQDWKHLPIGQFCPRLQLAQFTLAIRRVPVPQKV